MSEESGNLNIAINAVSISESIFLTVTATSPPTIIGDIGEFKMKLATYTMCARNPVKILKDLGYMEIYV